MDDIGTTFRALIAAAQTREGLLIEIAVCALEAADRAAADAPPTVVRAEKPARH